ncbi:MAG TPA: iron-sulfur-binding ferredoxin reductase [Pseudomonas sp.]|uniref:iron-sulfur-binding ferredoxin reductase n=1 Tax=Pseudomonas sp. TaxID=306 RepID=UPI002C61FBF4|nr:iron-sulfur-binding ferredoxin reductase [Pseudomonas sp.]HTO20286.1 iron-sulfur-binding ferredoxin reductase [Pseudomonas sp.]
MPELSVGDQHWSVEPGRNLLDALLDAGQAVPHSCRAGSCGACRVRCEKGEPLDAQPEALPASERAAGWRLACQCRVSEDLRIELFDPLGQTLPAEVVGHDWLSPAVLRLRLVPERPLRYQVGQHLLLWRDPALARPYSLASLPGEDAFLEFHVDCARAGAFRDHARQLRPGDPLRLSGLQGGALRYEAEWQEAPLWLLAAGTGLAPLWAILREALRQGHAGPIRLLHLARAPAEHYLAGPLQALARQHAQLQVEQLPTDAFDAWLSQGARPPRGTRALLCGAPARVEALARALYLAGLPRSQLHAEAFTGE